MSASSAPRAFTSATVLLKVCDVWGDGYGKVTLALPAGASALELEELDGEDDT